MYAVITGASSGLGAEFARQFAALGYDLCIAARRECNLISLKEEIESKYNKNVDILVADLSKEDEAAKLYEFTKDKNVDVLINNAGVSVVGMPYEDLLEREMSMMDINIRSVHYLTRMYLKDMIPKNHGKILNVASLAGWVPTPGISAYSACKAYVMHLTEGINYELKKINSNVQVSVVTPGFLNTEIVQSSGLDLKKQNRSVKKFIAKVIKKFLKGKPLILIGQDYKIIILHRFIPRGLAKALAYMMTKNNLVREK